MRCGEHRAALERREKRNLWDHCVLEHGGEEADFKYKVERGFHRDSLLSTEIGRLKGKHTE